MHTHDKCNTVPFIQIKFNTILCIHMINILQHTYHTVPFKIMKHNIVTYNRVYLYNQAKMKLFC